MTELPFPRLRQDGAPSPMRAAPAAGAEEEAAAGAEQTPAMGQPPLIRVARVVPETVAEGPGTRFAVWVQGCTIRCPGCFNPQYWTSRGGKLMSAAELLAEIPQQQVEGVTLLGGEPFEQAAALAPFARLVQQAGLSVMSFTGYTLQQLRQRAAAGDTATAQLLEATDLLIDGPFVQEQLDHERPWVGSRNQGFHTLTPRYQHLQGSWSETPDRLEITVATDGRVAVNGWADAEALDALFAEMRRAKEG